MNSNQKLRARIVLFLIIMAAGVLTTTLYKIQIVDGEKYVAKAGAQYVKPQSGTFERGTIYFSSKDGTKVAAASVSNGYLVALDPSQIKNPAQTFDALSEYLDLDRADFDAKIQKLNDHYEVLADHVPQKSGESIKGLKLAGVSVQPYTWRVYPGDELAAHALGLVGEDESSASLSGKYGLERSYNNVLTKTDPTGAANIFTQLFSGLQSVFGGTQSGSGNVVTSIEPTVQKYLEKTLSKTESAWQSDEIGGIVINPKTGEIVALASLPVFDPNNPALAKNSRIFSNPLVESSYEMGSIVKPLTMAAALDSGAVKPSTTYDDVGTMTLNTKKISNYDGVARGVVPMQEILSQSLNIGAATIALKTGKESFIKYFLSFGLGDKTGIDQPSESTPLINNLKSGREIEIATAAYGQGIAVSPINITRGLSILANGGYVITPHLVKEIEYDDGTVQKIIPSTNNPVLKKESVDAVTKMLVKVVDEKIAKSHPNIHFEKYSVAAKTGTAQIPNPTKGGYYDDRYLHSFFGYFPAYNPEFLVFLYQVYPKGAEYASETLTDPFSELANFLINYYDIAPDR